MAGLITLDLRHERREATEHLRRLGQGDGVGLVLQRTLNRVIPSVQSAATKAVVTELGATARFVRNSTKLRRARRRQLSAALQGDLKQIPLIAFAARQTKTGVSYKVGSQPRQTLEHGYINTGNSSGRRNVFRRARSDAQFAVDARLIDAGESGDLVGRYPTLIRYGPSVARTLLLDQVQRIMSTTARARWNREIEAQLRYYLSQQGLTLE